MSPIRFVLAVPLGDPPATSKSISSPLVVAPKLEEICGDRPQLWLGPGSTAIDLGPAGSIFGVMFERGSAVRVNVLAVGAPIGEGPPLIAKWLTSQCWGAYLAVFRDLGSGQLAAYPDPSGLLPVYRRETASHVLLSSEPGLLGEVLNGEPLCVSWFELQSYLAWPELRQRSTCLAGVSELTPGVLWTIGRSGDASVQIWRPQDFMPVGTAPTFESAAEELRDLATTTIGAWAGQFGQVAVAASGGVDSSLICAAMAKGGHAFDCITLATADPSGDESAFVRLLGDHLGVRTIASTYALSHVDLLRPASLGLARPSRKAFMVALERALVAAAGELSADVVFDGNGGDNLFCFLHSAAPLIDRLRAMGPRLGACSTFVDLCRLTGCDAGTMARAVLRRIMRPRPTGLWPPDLRLLADRPLAPPEPWTPWFEVDVGKHGGKRDHLALLMRGQNHVNDVGGLPRFSPLMSQPPVEFCLSVPTWLWCRGGINRALARAAFAPDLPREIVVRTSKAGPDSFIRKLFDANRRVIREGLLDGLLASQGVIDRGATEAALSVDALSGDSIVYRLLDLIEAEAWARSWRR